MRVLSQARPQGNAMNIHRSPLSGRNVEYYSQDGVHGGKFAAAVVAGVTSKGVMSSFNRIGMVNSQLNLAMHKLVRNEWSNRAIFETDAWQGTYCPLDLMVRQGDNQVLGAGTTLPDIGLEIGAWDADGNCVRVSDGAEGTFLSPTHHADFALRNRCALRRGSPQCAGNPVELRQQQRGAQWLHRL